MSCIITYKGNQYSEQEFKNYFNINTSEFIKKVATNKSVINSFKNRIDAINFVFQQAPELENIGTKIQYLQYLSTIFPNSKVKDIVYHGTDKEFDKFKKPSELGSQNRMIAFADDIEYAKIAGNRRNPLKKVISALVNITKIYPVDKLEAMELDSGYRDEVLNELKKEGIDGFAFESDDDLATRNFTEVLVFEPEQIHILGSKQDIQGFKDFVQSKQFQKLTAEEKAKTIEQVTKEHRSITALKDLAAKLAYRIGGKVGFENNPNVDWKGYNQGMTSVFNEAYMTPDTPFHEILAHPIIRAIKEGYYIPNYRMLYRDWETP